MSTTTEETPAVGTRETWWRAVWECRADGSRGKYDTEPREFAWSSANSGVWCGGHAVYGSRAVAEVNGWFRSPLKAVEARLVRDYPPSGLCGYEDGAPRRLLDVPSRSAVLSLPARTRAVYRAGSQWEGLAVAADLGPECCS